MAEHLNADEKLALVLKEYNPENAAQDLRLVSLHLIRALAKLQDTRVMAVMGAELLELDPNYDISKISELLTERRVPIDNDDFMDSPYYDFVMNVYSSASGIIDAD